MVLAYAVIQLYDGVQTDKYKIKQSVNSDYNYLVNQCVRDHIVLNWVTTLESRFKKFFESKHYISAVPYEEFEFDVPTEKGRIRRIRAQIIIDKKRNLKLAINNYGFAKVMGIVYFDKYLSNCVGLNNDGSDNGLTELINRCKKAAFNDGIGKAKKEKIEKLINQ